MIFSVDAQRLFNKFQHSVLTKADKKYTSQRNKNKRIIPKCRKECVPQNGDQHYI